MSTSSSFVRNGVSVSYCALVSQRRVRAGEAEGDVGEQAATGPLGPATVAGAPKKVGATSYGVMRRSTRRAWSHSERGVFHPAVHRLADVEGELRFGVQVVVLAALGLVAVHVLEEALALAAGVATNAVAQPIGDRAGDRPA